MNHSDKNATPVARSLFSCPVDLVVHAMAILVFSGLMYKGISSYFDWTSNSIFGVDEVRSIQSDVVR